LATLWGHWAGKPGYHGDYQTKSLDCTMDEFTISAEGRLIRTRCSGDFDYDDNCDRPLGDISYDGILALTGGSIGHGRAGYRRFELVFKAGSLIEIRCQQTNSRLLFEPSNVRKLTSGV